MLLFLFKIYYKLRIWIAEKTGIGIKIYLNENKTMPKLDFYSLKVLNKFNETNLESYRGYKLLIVNLASKCGFTPQYEDLENLFKK